MSLEEDLRTLTHALEAEAKAGRGEASKALVRIVDFLVSEVQALRAEVDQVVDTL